MKIYDCFTYFNETPMLDFRLRYLHKHVDVFVIVESRYTFTRKKKEMTASGCIKKLPSSISEKVRLIELREAPWGTSSQQYNWEREYYQRNAITRGLYDLSDEDYVIITDVDEIPSTNFLRVMPEIAKKRIPGLNINMEMFYYSASNQMFHNGKPLAWTLPKIIRATHLANPQTIRDSTKNWRSTTFNGWHFSYMGGQDRVLEKIKSFAHQELNTKEIIEKIPSQIQNNEDPFQRRYTFEQYQGYLPELIYSNNEYLEYFALDQKQAKRINI